MLYKYLFYSINTFVIEHPRSSTDRKLHFSRKCTDIVIQLTVNQNPIITSNFQLSVCIQEITLVSLLGI